MKTKNQAQGEIPHNVTINDASEADLPFISVLILELAESVDDSEQANLENIHQNFISLLSKPNSVLANYRTTCSHCVPFLGKVF